MDNTHCCSLRNKKRGRTHIAHRRKKKHHVPHPTEARNEREKQKHLLETAICIYFNNNKYCTKRRESKTSEKRETENKTSRVEGKLFASPKTS